MRSSRLSLFLLCVVLGSLMISISSKSIDKSKGKGSNPSDSALRLNPKKIASNPYPFPYSWNDLRKFLFYAYASFCFDNLKDWSCFWCLSKNVTGQYPDVNVSVPPVVVDVVLESDGLFGTYGYTGASVEAIVIAFRGSSSVDNWIHDLEFWLVDYPAISGAMVHYGFLDSYTAIQSTLMASLKKLRALHPQLPIMISGHSLGAAQSVFAAVDLALNGFTNIKLVNFGQPRVGNAVFAAAVEKLVTQHYRVVNMFDTVPHFPFQLIGYEHHSQEIWFQHNGYQFKVCNASIGEDPSCSDSLAPWQYVPGDHTLYLAINQNLQDSHGCGKPPSS